MQKIEICGTIEHSRTLKTIALPARARFTRQANPMKISKSEIRQTLYALEGGLLIGSASHAALEIDNIILNRSQKVIAINDLWELLNAKFSPADPDLKTVTVIRDVLEKRGVTNLNTVTAISSELQKFLDQLHEVISDPKRHDQIKLAELRDFCLAISEEASAYNLCCYK